MSIHAEIQRVSEALALPREELISNEVLLQRLSKRWQRRDVKICGAQVVTAQLDRLVSTPRIVQRTRWLEVRLENASLAYIWPVGRVNDPNTGGELYIVDRLSGPDNRVSEFFNFVYHADDAYILGQVQVGKERSFPDPHAYLSKLALAYADIHGAPPPEPRQFDPHEYAD